MVDWSSMTIGEKIKHIRESMGLSQGKLATGKKNPSIKTVIKLANALGLDLNNLIKS